MKKIWTRYTNAVKRNCTNPAHQQTELIFWRNNLFSSTIIYLIPLCLIALIPSLYLIFKTNLYVLAAVDGITFVIMLLIAFLPRISINTRKIIFITCVYLFAMCILFFIGTRGSGLLYLLMACVLNLLFFSGNRWYWPAWINVLCCLIYGIYLVNNKFPENYSTHGSISVWTAVSANLIFLSFLSTALIPKIFNSMQSTINNQILLQQNLDNSMKNVQQKNEELEEFAFIASHDLQEPLRMISSFLTQLEKKYNQQLDDRARQYIQFSVNGAQRMNSMIKDLLEYSRIGKFSDPREVFDVNDLITDLKTVFKRELAEKRAVIRTGNLPQINTNRNMLYQVLQNLVGNALKYSRANTDPEIEITCREFKAHWEFCCSDNGIGIQPEYFEKIFIIFQRLHGREEYKGSGIGLAISKKIVEYLGGKIWVTSISGEGSKFYFTILKQENDTVHH